MRVALRKRGDVIAKKATTIAIVNQKGGTAKTTTCENLGIGLAMEGKKVLLVDVDPQGSLTISMGWQQPDELSTTLSTLMQKAMNDQPIQPGDGILHHAEGVDLIPANIELAGIPELLNMVDEKMISFNPAVELSYLSPEQQQEMIKAMDDTQNAPSVSQAKRIKELAQKGQFTSDAVVAIMGEEKKGELDTVTIKNDILRKYFPRSYTPRQMEEKIIQLLDAWQKKRQRSNER